MKGWRGSTSYVKGEIWVEGRDIIDIGFSKDGTSINEVYFEDHGLIIIPQNMHSTLWDSNLVQWNFLIKTKA